MPSFVHTADLHLDTPFSARFTQRQAELRRQEMLQTFQQIAQRASEADLFFLSGDIFDSELVSGDTIAFLKRCFSNMPHTLIFIAAGNHDPFTENSIYHTLQWGKNVHIFSTEMEYVDLPQWNLRVHGRSFREEHEPRPILTVLEKKENWSNVLVLHGDVIASGESMYGPILKDDLERSGVEYAALGHIHQYSGIQRAGDTFYAYPGIPEGRGFDETGRKGFIAGEISKGRVTAEWIPVNRRSFWEITVDVSMAEDRIHVLETVRNKMKEKGSTDDIFRIILTGKLDQNLIQPELLEDQLKDSAFYFNILNRTRPAYSLQEIAEEPTLRGAFVRDMLEKMKNMPKEEQEIGFLAIEIGLRAMEER